MRSFPPLRCLLLLCCVMGAWAQGGPPGGIVSKFLTLSDQTLLIYAATSHGVVRSEDGGLSWTATGERLKDLNISAIAGVREVLYAASAVEGVFRSRDGGDTWEQVNSGLDTTAIITVALDPTNANVAYAGSLDGGIFKTTNGADQWAPARTGLTEGAYLDIEVDPGNPQILYAAHASTTVAGAGGLFKSTDGGQTWAGSVGPAVYSVSFESAANTNTIYVGTNAGLIKTSDGGATFASPVLRGATIVDVAVDPSDPAVVYAASQYTQVAKSTDGGQNWVLASQGMPRTELTTIAVSPQESSTLLAGSVGGGVYRSVDAAGNWDPSARGIDSAQISALATSPAAEKVIAAVFNGGAFRSSNAGASWGPAYTGLETFQIRTIKFDPVNPEIVYAGSVNPFNASDGSLFKSTDGGATWQAAQQGAAIYAIAAHPTDGRTLYVGTPSGVFRSIDAGANFQNASGPNGEVAARVVDLEINPSRPDTILTILYDSFTGFYQIYGTTNGGASWSGIGSANQPLLDVMFDPADTSRVYIGGVGVFRSIDGGAHFVAASSGLPAEGVLVPSVAIDPNDNSTLYISTDAGVYRSTDRGDSWQLANEGLGDQVAIELAVSQQGGAVYAGTADGGVFKTTDRGDTWQPTGGVPIFGRAGVVNAADFVGGGIAPGEIISIFGQQLGPPEGVQPGIDPQTGKLATSAAGVRVFFNDVAAPLFFVRQDQLNVQVPFEVVGSSRATIRAEYQGAVTARDSVQVVSADPGLFSAVLNQDGSVNTAGNTESSGRVVQLFATGQGAVQPEVSTGQLAPAAEPFARPTQDVTVTIGGKPATVHFAGLAPGFIGLLQINAEITNGVAGGAAEIQVEIGGRRTSVGGKVWVK